MRFILMLVMLLLSACSDPPPQHSTHICSIFKKYPQWFWAAQESERTWGVPIATQMAIIYEESSFRDSVKPRRTKLFGFIPWTPSSSASGYSQALNPTWQLYLKETNRIGASRASFSNAVDFIGWFYHRAHKRLQLKPSDVSNFYLAYHEGIHGYKNRSYMQKPWLAHVAQGVQVLANRYQKQLLQCQDNLPKKPWWRFW